MIKTQKTDIENVKAQIDEYLYSNSISFVCNEHLNEIGEKVYFYGCEPEQIGIMGVVDGKFSGTVLDNGRVNCALKEGFEKEDVNENHLIWIKSETVEDFLKNFVPAKKYED